MNNLSIPGMIAAWMIPVFIGLLGLLVLRKIYTNKISLQGLINESSGEASMSRFQFLIFTFVIATGGRGGQGNKRRERYAHQGGGN